MAAMNRALPVMPPAIAAVDVELDAVKRVEAGVGGVVD